MHRLALAHTCVNFSNSLMLLKSQSYTVPLIALAPKQDMRAEPKQNSMFSPRNSQVPRPETLPQGLSPNRTRLVRRTTGSNRPKYQRGTKQARNQRWRRPEAGARAAYLLAGEGRGEEVDAVGAAPQRLLLRRQRLRAARLRGAAHLHGPRLEGGGRGILLRPARRGGDRDRSGSGGKLGLGEPGGGGGGGLDLSPPRRLGLGKGRGDGPRPWLAARVDYWVGWSRLCLSSPSLRV